MEAREVAAGVRMRLSALMFVEYAIWGAWMFYLVRHLEGPLKLGPADWAPYFMAVAFASLIAPWIAGQLADRWMATEKILGLSHLAGAVLLTIIAFVKDPTAAFWLLLAYLIIYMPTLGLANSLSFHHLTDPERQFGSIRVFGSFGWIAALCLDSLILYGGGPVNYIFLVAALFSYAGGFTSFRLPHTPPQRGQRTSAIWEATKLMRDRSFATMIFACLILGAFFQFYFNLNAQLISGKTGLGLEDRYVGLINAGASLSEFVALPLFAAVVGMLGLKRAFLLGIGLWAFRYLVFATVSTVPVVASFFLHGFCFTFVYVVSQVYVNKVAQSDIRASAQSFLNAVIMGIGPFIGAWLTSKVPAWTDSNFTTTFLVAFGGTAVAGVVFAMGFKGVKQPEPAAEQAPAPAPPQEG